MPALGAWAGWMAVLFLGRSGPITFVPGLPPDGIINACVPLGYPKQQDFFWYALMLAAGPVGGWDAAFFWRRLAAWGEKRPAGGIHLEAAAACAVLATILALANAPGWLTASAVLALAAAGLPWFDRRWYASAPPVAESASAGGVIRPWHVAAALGLAVVWVFDSCLLRRPIDGFHEGSKLLFVQSFLAGDRPGVDVAIDYGPLYLHSVWWWMKLAGVSLAALRWHFLVAQAVGLAVQILVLRALAGTGLAVAAGVWSLLAFSSVAGIQYGMPNALRLALPMAALAVWGRGGRTAPILAGALTAAAWLFSPEYGMAAAAACAVAAIVDGWHDGWRRAAGSLGVWTSTAGATVLGLLLVMYGTGTGEALRGLLGGGHGAARLLGQGAWPAPRPVWWVSASDAWFDRGAWYSLASYWGPGLLCSGVAAWLLAGPVAPLRRGRVAGWLAFASLALVPVVIRPAGQQVNAIAATAGLLVLAIDSARGTGSGGRRAALGGAAAIGVAGLVALSAHAGDFAAKGARCLGDLRTGASAGSLPRLGGVQLPERARRDLDGAVAAVRAGCPPGGRVYVAAISWAHVPFLADRAGLRPYPLAALTATRGERDVVLAALDRERPAVALVTEAGFDVPFAAEHPEEAAYVAAHYRLVKRFGDLRVMARLGPSGPVRLPGSGAALPFDSETRSGLRAPGQ